jgi:hypothetical protein
LLSVSRYLKQGLAVHNGKSLFLVTAQPSRGAMSFPRAVSGNPAILAAQLVIR